MRNRSAFATARWLLLVPLATLAVAQPAAALDADYWRGGWRTPLDDDPHIYHFVIRGDQVTGVYCRSCSDVTTVGFIDGTWDETDGIDFTVTFANPDGSIASVDEQRAMLVDGRLIVDGADGRSDGLALVKDPRGADPGGAPAYHLPPGTPPAMPAPRPVAGGGGGGGGRGAAPPAYWQPGPYQTLEPADVAGTWIASSFGLGMNKQYFTFLRVGDQLRGVVCGRCDNPYTMGALENIVIVGDTMYFDIVHQDWGEIDPPKFDRQIAARVVQNEMTALILGNDVDVDPANPPALPAGRGFTLLGPIAPAGTIGNSSEGVDVWGPGTGSSVAPPPRVTPIVPVNPGQ
jgi:hypothetical protein